MATESETLQRKVIDAGVRRLDHYQSQLPKWRFSFREALIPIVRWETPILAALQEQCRTPALDSYFAFTANLGTHTFFMTFLPILFWSGEVQMARAMVNLLASGVFFSGFVKDMLCLPRPLSPPLQRITRSHSAALEYGFPSTHSTNAVSVAVYAIYNLNTTTRPMTWQENVFLQALTYLYVFSICIGRLYCGMHGFFDVVFGSALGAALAVLQCVYGERFDHWIMAGPFYNTLIICVICLILVRVHPEPADDCPCFDDSVAFAGVLMGLQVGNWHFEQSGYASNSPVLGAVPFSLHKIGLLKAILRLIIGVVVIFAWRAIAKPTLLKVLPPFFRVIEQLGLTLPRAFHLRASEYTTVDDLRTEDNVIPRASEIPAMLSSLSHPRKRTVSVGPQSEADVYEAIAMRDRKRRDSSLERNLRPPSPTVTRRSLAAGRPNLGDRLATDAYLQLTPNGEGPSRTLDVPTIAVEGEDEVEDEELFQRLSIPRVRYDVEVVTKLIVYAGIAWISAEANPILFEHLALGMGVRPGSPATAPMVF